MAGEDMDDASKEGNNSSSADNLVNAAAAPATMNLINCQLLRCKAQTPLSSIGENAASFLEKGGGGVTPALYFDSIIRTETVNDEIFHLCMAEQSKRKHLEKKGSTSPSPFGTTQATMPPLVSFYSKEMKFPDSKLCALFGERGQWEQGTQKKNMELFPMKPTQPLWYIPDYILYNTDYDTTKVTAGAANAFFLSFSQNF